VPFFVAAPQTARQRADYRCRILDVTGEGPSAPPPSIHDRAGRVRRGISQSSCCDQAVFKSPLYWFAITVVILATVFVAMTAGGRWFWIPLLLWVPIGYVVDRRILRKPDDREGIRFTMPHGRSRVLGR
jgi:hypothetical protein